MKIIGWVFQWSKDQFRGNYTKQLSSSHKIDFKHANKSNVFNIHYKPYASKTSWRPAWVQPADWAKRSAKPAWAHC